MINPTESLPGLLRDRASAWSAMSSNRVLRVMSAEKRQCIDSASTAFRSADETIVALLKSLHFPPVVDLDGKRVQVWLTRDLLSFALVDPATGKQVHCPGSSGIPQLHDYPRPRTARRLA